MKKNINFIFLNLISREFSKSTKKWNSVRIHKNEKESPKGHTEMMPMSLVKMAKPKILVAFG